MKRRTLLSAGIGAAAASLVPSTGYASTRDVTAGEARDDLWMPSAILGMDVGYALYLPPGHDPARDYPVLFMLHGTEGTASAWLEDEVTIPAFDAAIAEGRLPPTIGIFPDGRRDPTRSPLDQPLAYWMNDADGGFRYHDMIMDEMLPFVTAVHRAGGVKHNTAIGGLSMGGFGALSFTMRHPDRFVATFSMSAGQRTDQQILDLSVEDWNWRYGGAWGYDLIGADRLNPVFREWNLPDVLYREGDVLNATGYWLDCGEQDEFLVGNNMLNDIMTETGVAHQYSTRPGGHDWDVWAAAMPLGLDFIGGYLAGC